MSTWNDPELQELFLKKTPLIDVRAPVEFAEGSIPHSINLPIMNDEERRLVGTCYKEQGQAEAIKLGHELVSGKIKEERIERWREEIRQRPETEVFCFRGGLRSQISCEWIGMGKKPIPGGYKRLRRFFISLLEDAPLPGIVRIGGLTGSGKTRVLEKIKHHIDLEELAHHRGSAFGPRGPQPSQIRFENEVGLALLKNLGHQIVVEDESATLGKVVVPQRLFKEMRNSPLVILEVDPEERLHNIFNDYVKDASAEFFLSNLVRIQKKLGATKVKELSDEIARAFSLGMEVKYHEAWISTLLEEYYDPLYQKDLRYNEEKVLFRGKAEEILAYLKAN